MLICFWILYIIIIIIVTLPQLLNILSCFFNSSQATIVTSFRCHLLHHSWRLEFSLFPKLVLACVLHGDLKFTSWAINTWWTGLCFAGYNHSSLGLPLWYCVNHPDLWKSFRLFPHNKQSRCEATIVMSFHALKGAFSLGSVWLPIREFAGFNSHQNNNNLFSNNWAASALVLITSEICWTYSSVECSRHGPVS